MNETLHTPWGNARINDGYYRITSRKEGFHGKKLHRLIYENYHKCTILSNGSIHHLDGNKLNNDISNLKLMDVSEHHKLHMKDKNHPLYDYTGENHPMYGKHHSEKTKQLLKEKLSGKNSPLYGTKLSESRKIQISDSKNTTGYFRVSKNDAPTTKQGFRWRYLYYEDGKQKSISSVDIKKLETKVKEKGLAWVEFKKGV